MCTRGEREVKYTGCSFSLDVPLYVVCMYAARREASNVCWSTPQDLFFLLSTEYNDFVLRKNRLVISHVPVLWK